MDKNVNLVIPGILESDWIEIERKIQLVTPFAKTIHIDLIDGKFAPHATFIDPAPFSKYTQDIEFELHMMVEEPINYLKKFADAGFRRFIGHIEKMSDQSEFVRQGKLFGEVGFAVDSPTSISEIKTSMMDLDVLLIMTVKAGESGQQFVEENLNKIKNIKERNSISIEVDGGVNLQNIVKAREHGVTRFVATSAIFREGNPQENYEKLEALLD